MQGNGGKEKREGVLPSPRSVCLFLPDFLRPGILQGDGPVEHGPFRGGIRVSTEISLPQKLKLLQRSRLREPGSTKQFSSTFREPGFR